MEIERALEIVVREHVPTAASVESLFFQKDAQAAAKLGHARGVALLVCARAGLRVAEYPPARVKLTVAGGGRADKNQVAQMVRVLLNLATAPRSDAADALALAVTHLQRAHLEQKSQVAELRAPPSPLAALLAKHRAATRASAAASTHLPASPRPRRAPRQ